MVQDLLDLQYKVLDSRFPVSKRSKRTLIAVRMYFKTLYCLGGGRGQVRVQPGREQPGHLHHPHRQHQRYSCTDVLVSQNVPQICTAFAKANMKNVLSRVSTDWR